MSRLRQPGLAVACFCAFSAGAFGQVPAPAPPAGPPPGAKSGNPTPGTPQPDAPTLADRITLTGCVQLARSESRGGATTDLNAPSDSKYLLIKAARKNVVPPGTGTSPAAAEPARPTYRLSGIDSQLSPFVGAAVEISGEILTSPAKGGGEGEPPALLVEFVQKLSPKCS